MTSQFVSIEEARSNSESRSDEVSVDGSLDDRIVYQLGSQLSTTRGCATHTSSDTIGSSTLLGGQSGGAVESSPASSARLVTPWKPQNSVTTADSIARRESSHVSLESSCYGLSATAATSEILGFPAGLPGSAGTFSPSSSLSVCATFLASELLPGVSQSLPLDGSVRPTQSADAVVTGSKEFVTEDSATVAAGLFSEELTPEAIDLMLSANASGNAQTYCLNSGASAGESLLIPMWTEGTLPAGQVSRRPVGEYDNRPGIFLLGTGPSTSIPQIEHVFSTVLNPEEQGSKKCRNCLAAWADPLHPNNCDNICAVIAVPEPLEFDESCGATRDTLGNEVAPASGADSPSVAVSASPVQRKRKHILIDIGKTFRQSMLKWMPNFAITQIDAVLLTHEHQDAFGGMDELRCLQRFAPSPGDKGQIAMFKYAAQSRLPVVLSQKCMSAVERAYSYIVEASRCEVPIDRKVAVVDFEPQRVPDDDEPIDDAVDKVVMPAPVLDRLLVRKLPVYHGGDFVSLGYAFGRGYESVIYISDVSWISDRTIRLIDSYVPFKVLVIDSLYDSHPHFSHLCLYEAYDLIDRWRPAQTYIVGMGCMIDRIRMNEHLADTVLPNLRSGNYKPYKFSCIGSGDPKTFRPLQARRRLQTMEPVHHRPPSNHIETVQVALDGTFIHVDFQLDPPVPSGKRADCLFKTDDKTSIRTAIAATPPSIQRQETSQETA